MQRMILNIKGMDGVSSERRLCRQICKIPGIKGVSANSADGLLIAYYDQKTMDIKALLEGISQCGYAVL